MSGKTGDADQLVERQRTIAAVSEELAINEWFVGKPVNQLVWASRIYDGIIGPALTSLRAELEQDAVDADKLADSIQAKLETVWNKHVAAEQRVAALVGVLNTIDKSIERGDGPPFHFAVTTRELIRAALATEA